MEESVVRPHKVSHLITGGVQVNFLRLWNMSSGGGRESPLWGHSTAGLRYLWHRQRWYTAQRFQWPTLITSVLPRPLWWLYQGGNAPSIDRASCVFCNVSNNLKHVGPTSKWVNIIRMQIAWFSTGPGPNERMSNCEEVREPWNCWEMMMMKWIFCLYSHESLSATQWTSARDDFAQRAPRDFKGFFLFFLFLLQDFLSVS